LQIVQVFFALAPIDEDTEQAGKDVLKSMADTQDQMLASFARDIPGAAFYYSVHPDGSDSIEIMSSQSLEIWGLDVPRDAVTPDMLWALTHPQDLARMQASVETSAKTLSVWEQSWRIIDPSGNKKWLHGRGTPEARPDGSTRWLTFVFDITSQIVAETKAAKAIDQLAAATEAIPDGFALFDERERLVACNAAYRALFDRIQDRLVPGETFEALLRASVQAGHFVINLDDQEAWITERLKQFRRADGKAEVGFSDGRWLRMLDRPTKDGGRVSFRVDITRTKSRQAELENAALTDALTGLWNRRGMSEQLKAMENQLRPGERIALLHLDLDKFKTVNDALGHEAGDFVLQEIATALLAAADERTAVARVGGDEFVCAMPGEHMRDDLSKQVECLRAGLTKPRRFKGRMCQVGATVGIAFWTQGSAESLEQSLLDADTALMQGKAQGRNRIVFFESCMRHQAVETARIASKIKEGLRRREFFPVFQPQIQLPEGQVSGFEVLVRWTDKDGAVTPASDFIHVANETGLIVDIDREMLQQGLDGLHRLMATGLDRPSLSVNLASATLRSPDLLDIILDAVGWRGIAHDQLNIEILESTLLDDRSDMIAQNINALARLGFRIELDDFGTGHTALASLRRFPVHRIKIDRSLITSIDTDTSLQAITEGIHSLCARLGVETIAEGIETEGELEKLRDIGITQFQGYFLAKPMPFDAITAWLSQRKRSEPAMQNR